MKKVALWISTLTLGLFFVVSTIVGAEVIKSFDSQIVINTDASISVVETILYDSEGLEKHGIFRDITSKSSTGQRMIIKGISITDQDGLPYEWQKINNNGDLRLKIGDPNVTFNGQKTYIIHYVATDAIAHLDNSIDEIYWNVTGNNWPFNVESVTASVTLPDGAIQKQSSCYQGVIGATDSCNIEESGIYFKSTTSLPSGEGMTIALGFPSGFIFDYVPTAKEKILAWVVKFWPIMIPLFTFIFMFRRWHKKGRDPKGSGIIIPEYDAPDGLTPIEVGFLLSDKFRKSDISAEIIYLATKGYFKIVEVENKGVFSKKDYQLIRQKDFSDVENEFDRKILDSIFGVKSSLVSKKNLSSLEKKFYVSIHKIEELVKKNLRSKEYYKNLPNNISPIVLILFFLISVKAIALFRTSPNTALILISASVVSFIIFGIFQSIMPAKSIKGIKTREQILGLKKYLNIAEKERLQFHNAPDKKPELFEKLLPYAMVFGVEKEWAEEFENIYTTPPSWYEGHYDTFNPRIFVGNLNTFENRTLSTVTSTPRSSSVGSGGGGSSGGGGGGGGGGSW